MPTKLNDCGCCEGITAIVPESIFNRPGLSRVEYRVGTQVDFLRSALAALSDPEFTALRNLTTRDTDDFTIALLDGWATVADVLSFYQERIANELWLRTATERDSILRLAQLIGYRLKPGVAAETPLSFLLDDTPGAPTEVTVKTGTKVQSVPGVDEKPQTFETIEEIEARVEWNALKPALTTPPAIAPGVNSLYLKGTATNLNVGDAILIVGDERDQHPNDYPDKERWDFRLLLSVTPDPKNNRTQVTWETGLGKAPILPAAKNVKVYAFRQLAARFGHNAPDPSLVTLPGDGAVGTWGGFGSYGSPMDLDNAYPKIVAGSWVAFVNNDGYAEIYKLVTVTFYSRTNFGLSGKVTHIALDTTEHLELFPRRETVIYAQSERLEMSSGPLVTPVAGSIASALARDPDLLAPIEGSVIQLDRLVPPLEPGRKVLITGKLLRARIAATSLKLTSADGSQNVTIGKDDSLTLTTRPTLLPGNSAKFTLRTDEGFEGTVTTDRGNLILTTAGEKDATISELAVVQECSGEPTVLTLEGPPLTHLFDRATVTIAANVSDATHGETVSEILGNGDGSKPNQTFKLKQTPALTYTRSTAPGGAESSLQIRVNDLLWHEVPTLFKRGPRDRIFTTEMADDGTVTVRFGDGMRGARLPSSAQNVKATYRRGSGLDGLVRAGQLTSLLTRPLGLKSALNPLAAEGADEPESFANAQQNAPLTVLTLERVVSLEDYENFSRSYAGIAKALATWTWDGRTCGVFLTLAAPLGAAVSNSLIADLITTIHAAGDPFVPVRAVSYQKALFRIAGKIKIDPDYEVEKVLAAASDTLRDTFSFANRQFGQPVNLSEVIALVQAVYGVVAVDVDSLYRTGATVKLNNRLEAELPHGGDPASLAAAELLTLDPAPIDLDVMP
jgi:hypothetical protein